MKLSILAKMGGGSGFLFLMACQSPVSISTGSPPDGWPANGTAPIIYHAKTGDGTIQSYQADVEVYSQNNHKVGLPKLVQKYKMAAKIIDGRLYTRLDVGADLTPEHKSRAYVSDGKQLVVVDPVAQRVLARAYLPTPNGKQQDLSSTQTKSVFGKIPLAQWKASFQKQNFDMNEDKATGLLGVTIPGDLLLSQQSLSGYKIVKAKLLFDSAQETQAGMEMQVTTADGQNLTFVSQPVYAEKDGMPVKVADVTRVIDPSQKDAPAEADYPYALPPSKVDEVPIVTQEQLRQMAADGDQVSEIDPVVSSNDPQSPDTTMITTYDQIHLNETPDSYMKLGL